MFSFASPFWLLALIPLGLLGTLVLRRQTAARVALPTLRFFPHEENASVGRAQRDWRWLPVVIAALLILLTLAGPIWNAGSAPRQTVAMRVSARIIPDTDKLQIFMKIDRPEWLTPQTELSVILSNHEAMPAATMPSQTVRAESLEKGMIFDTPANDSVHVALMKSRGVLAQAWLSRNQKSMYFIDMRASSAPLERVLRVQKSVDSAWPSPKHTSSHRIVIVDSNSGNIGPLAAGDMLIMMGRASVNGIRFAQQDHESTGKIETATQSPLLRHIQFDNAHAGTIVKAEMDQSWQVLAKVDGFPFLAMRESANSPRILWIASTLRDSSTNWPLHPSFVIFFTNLLSDMRVNADRPADEWTMQSEPDSQSTEPIHLSAATGIAALCCLLAGAWIIFPVQKMT